MTGPSPHPPAKHRPRFWITLGEAVAVLALVIAGLNYWDSHRERTTAARQAAVAAQAQTAFVMTGTADASGDQITLRPLNPAQAIQSQRYVFPHAVLDHAMEVSAAQPQIDAAWIASGLTHALDIAHAAKAGEASLPVGVVTTYVEDGETRTDRSIYRLGYAYRTRLLFGRSITLEGVSLVRRGVHGDLAAAVDARWAAGAGGAS